MDNVEIKIDEIVKQKSDKKQDGTPYTLTTFKGSRGYDHWTANTFHKVEIGHTYEGELIKPPAEHPTWLPKFEVKEEIIQTEPPKEPKVKTDIYVETHPKVVSEIQPQDNDTTTLKMKLLYLAVEHYRKSEQSISYKDIMDTAEKWFEWVVKPKEIK